MQVALALPWILKIVLPSIRTSKLSFQFVLFLSYTQQKRKLVFQFPCDMVKKIILSLLTLKISISSYPTGY
jgi:hypothetical protein